MPLTLTIRNADVLENGSPLSLILDRRGAIIGRAPTCDWCLPDPNLYISSRHCEVQFRDGTYILNDISTNGTFLRGTDTRLPGPHAIGSGDCFVVGHFEIAAALDDATASAMAQRNAAPQQPQWQGWDAHRGADSAAAAATPGQWDAVRSGAAISGTGPMSQNWAPPTAEAPPAGGSWGAPAASPASPPPPPPPAAGWGAPAAPPPSPPPSPVGSGWGAAPPTAVDQAGGWAGAPAAPAAPTTAEASPWAAPAGPSPTPASDWSAPVSATPEPPSAGDIWGQFAESNVVDWARGGFGSAPPPPVPVPMPAAATGADLQPLAAPAQTPTTPAQPAAAPPQPAAAPRPAGGTGLAELLATAGIAPGSLKRSEAESLQQAGQLMRSLVAGLVVLLEARARAKTQLGAQGTSLEFDGNNPLKFARTPEQALAQLLNPPERGFMPADRAIEDSFRDLQAHQMATLKAMQGALKTTLDRFSPQAIRARAQQVGLLSKILPNAKDAALWAAYEREFSGVAQGSDEAFMDVFAKEFRRAYEELAGKA